MKENGCFDEIHFSLRKITKSSSVGTIFELFVSMVFQAVTASAERMFVKKKNLNTKYMFYHCYLAINSFHFKYIFLLLLFKTHDKNTRVRASQCVWCEFVCGQVLTSFHSNNEQKEQSLTQNTRLFYCVVCHAQWISDGRRYCFNFLLFDLSSNVYDNWMAYTNRDRNASNDSNDSVM